MAAPVVNINTSGAKGLTNIDSADSTTGWAGFNDGTGGTPSPVQEQDIFIQGTAAVSTKISGTSQNKGLWFDTTTGVDMTVSGRHFYIWIAVTTVSLLNTISAGGLYLKVASDAAGNNWNKYFVGGSDVTSDARFIRYVIDLNKTPSETAATAATLTSIRWFGAGIKSNGTSKSENLIIDRPDYGDGLQIEAGDSTDPAAWLALFNADNDINNKYGIIEERSGIFYLKGGITNGDPAGTVTTLWQDATGAAVVFENPLYHNGTALVSAIDAANLYNIELRGNATGTTDITWGTVIGTGDDRQGLNGGSISSAGPPWTLDGETDIADLDTVNLYGMTLQGAGVTQFSGSTKTDIIGCTFVGCDEMQPNDAEFLNNVVIAPVPDRGVEITTTSTVKQTTFVAGATGAQDVTRAWVVDITPTPNVFIDETADVNSAATADVTPFPLSETVNDYFAIGYVGKFQSLSVDVGTAGTVGVAAWEYWSGASWTALSGVTDGTNSFTTAGVNTVTYTVPTDWAATSLLDETPLFYVRARVTTVYTVNPVLDEVDIVDPIEHHVHYVDATKVNGYTADALTFFGFGAAGAPKWHGENSATRVTITAGSFVTNQWYEILTVGSTDFTLIGAADNNIGTQFKATGAGTGTGTAFEVLALNSSNGTTAAANEFDNTGATAGDTRVVSSETVTFEAIDDNGAAIQSVLVTAYLIADDSEVINATTNASGIASTTFAGSTPADIYYRYRKASTGATKYVNLSGLATIASGSGVTVKRNMKEDTTADPSI